MATLRLFAQARESVGSGTVDIPGDTVGEILDQAVAQFGDRFQQVLSGSKVWLNGNPADRGEIVSAGDEVAVLPPVSGG